MTGRPQEGRTVALTNAEKVRRWKARNPERTREQNREYKVRHRDAIKEREHRYREGKGPDWTRERHLRRKYGLTLTELRKMAERQGNRCPICLRSFADVAMCVDHDHETGRIRGLLCDRVLCDPATLDQGTGAR